jgi:hypothetical protein
MAILTFRLIYISRLHCSELVNVTQASLCGAEIATSEREIQDTIQNSYLSVS